MGQSPLNTSDVWCFRFELDKWPYGHLLLLSTTMTASQEKLESVKAHHVVLNGKSWYEVVPILWSKTQKSIYSQNNWKEVDQNGIHVYYWADDFDLFLHIVLYSVYFYNFLAWENHICKQTVFKVNN